MLLSFTEISHVNERARDLSDESRFPKWGKKLTRVSEVVGSIGDDKVGRRFVLADMVVFDAKSNTPRLMPVLGRQEPVIVTLKSLIRGGSDGRVTGLVFEEDYPKNQLIIGDTGFEREFGILEYGYCYSDNIRTPTPGFLKWSRDQRDASIPHYINRDKEGLLKVAKAIKDHLAILAGRVTTDLLDGKYSEELIRKVISDFRDRYVERAAPDKVAHLVDALQLKEINSDLKSGVFVLIEGSNGIHIYQVEKEGKSGLKRKSGYKDFVELTEFTVIPNYNSNGRSVLESIRGTSTQIFTNGILKGRIFDSREALLEYLPRSNTEMRHMELREALVTLCKTLAEIEDVSLI